MTWNRVQDTRPTYLKPRPDVSLSVLVGGFLIGFAAGYLTAMTLLANRIWP